ncbi:nuclear transport factor 2 family protein [Roseibium sp. SCP14]|uniref:nuclear transport factor 2 family protein n=1 Tax=Roseibium sp. SCP14 TaxID=3141375 RepID=UPI003334F8D7
MTQTDSNKQLVRQAFQPWEQGDSGPFFDLVADDVKWTVIGSTPVSGVYHSKQDLIDRAFGPLLKKLEGRMTTRLVDIAGEGEKVFLQFTSYGVTKSGLKYNQTYCFAMVVRNDRIAEIVAYIDTDLLRRVLA